MASLLLPWINCSSVVGLNAHTANTASRVLRPYDNRLDKTQYVESPEGDEELMINVPFTSPVQVTGITVIGGPDGISPSKVKLYCNREEFDFTSVEGTEATQELSLREDFHGEIQLPLRSTKFQVVTHLSLYFPESHGGSFTRIHWLGIWGYGSEHKREAVHTKYELLCTDCSHGPGHGRPRAQK
eukprot:TRINITY_DN28233_c0_g1_i1.p1 TRINITY_DN28233_c0_g1~~TRINITY_DN28233_c0_g1_i1.p1  ORF type:complete len:192 (-),score=7.14 TRINITY_DN28233_c0_g1_i1:375-929(-)